MYGFGGAARYTIAVGSSRCRRSVSDHNGVQSRTASGSNGRLTWLTGECARFHATRSAYWRSSYSRQSFGWTACPPSDRRLPRTVCSSPCQLAENRSTASHSAPTSASTGVTPLPPLALRSRARSAPRPVTRRARLTPARYAFTNGGASGSRLTSLTIPVTGLTRWRYRSSTSPGVMVRWPPPLDDTLRAGDSTTGRQACRATSDGSPHSGHCGRDRSSCSWPRRS